MHSPPHALPRHDLHNHTVHCGHAADDATAANLIAQAAAIGLSCLGFSEHVIFAEDAPRVAAVRDDLSRLPPPPPGLTVLVGVEMDADPHRADGSWVAGRGDADYVILSPHRIPRYGVGHWAFHQLGLSEPEKRRLGQMWLDWYEACIEKGGVDILGHPLREPIRLGMLTLKDSRTFDRALGILRRAGRRGVVFELNNGWAIGVREQGEFEQYVSLIRELKGEGMRFCCGSDSHAVSEVGTNQGIFALAEAAGLEPHDWLSPDELLAPPRTS